MPEPARRQNRQDCKWVTGLCTPGHPAPLRGVPGRVFAAFDALLKPVHHLAFNPSHPVRADLNRLRELPGLFQARDMLGRVQDRILALTLRQYPHHDVSLSEEHRDAQGYDNTQVEEGYAIRLTVARTEHGTSFNRKFDGGPAGGPSRKTSTKTEINHKLIDA